MISKEQIERLYKMLEEEKVEGSDVWASGYNRGVDASTEAVKVWLLSIIGETN